MYMTRMAEVLVKPVLILLAIIVRCTLAAQESSQTIVFPNHHAPPPKFLQNRISCPRATGAVHNAALRILQLSWERTNSNWVVSPASLATVIGQLMLGARGEFHNVLGDILSPERKNSKRPGLEVHKELGNLLHMLQSDEFSKYQLFINSALFVHPEIELKNAYKHALTDIYNVDVLKTNFSSAPEDALTQINKWVNGVTMGHIESVLPHPAAPTTASLFINTVYFKGNWKTPFKEELTTPGFFNLNKTHQVPADFMLGEIEALYAESEKCDCTLIGVPYEDSAVVLYIFLPNKHPSGSHYDLYDFATKMDISSMSEIIATAEPHNLTLVLPKINLSTSLSLRKPIVKAVNLTKFSAKNSIRESTRDVKPDVTYQQLFSNSYQPQPLPLKIQSKSDKVTLTFNMGSASDDFRFQINDIVHKVELAINEKGTEAIAISTTLIDYFGTKLIKVNRPFSFLIRHEVTRASLFWGIVFTPETFTKKAETVIDIPSSGKKPKK